MKNYNREIVSAIVRGHGLKEVLRGLLEDEINHLLTHELSAYLGYEAYDRKGFNSGDSRNGHYYRTFHSEYGPLNLIVPRDRNGKFVQYTIPYRKCRSSGLENAIIKLYSRGITTREIAHLIQEMYGNYYQPQTISNITKSVNREVKAFRQRELSSKYAVVYLEDTYVPLRRDVVSKEAVYIAIGIKAKANGNKEVLGYTIAHTESAHVWSKFLERLQSQGLKSVLLFVTDSLHGMPKAISDRFPKSKYQQCLVHAGRDIYSLVRIRDRRDILNDFKLIYHADSFTSGKVALKNFADKWYSRYPRLINNLRNNRHLLTFLEFPRAIRSSIYSTNLIESFNKKFKRQVKQREQFPNENSVERVLITVISDYNYKFSTRAHKGFKQVKDTLDSMFI